ncbi:MAG TPA: hypothetical protein VG099_07940 [Gemmataceae bacterium]|nr:hypothetical protein [Gemmataceae bacterium]
MNRHLRRCSLFFLPWLLTIGLPSSANCQTEPTVETQIAALCETCKDAPACCRDHTYIFLVNGLDPINYGNLTGLRDFANAMGFRQTYYGQIYHVSYFKKQMRRIKQEDPQAHFVLVGFSVGVNLVHSMASSVKADGIWVDALVYLSGNNPVTPIPKSRPENVGHVVNLLAGGMMKDFGECAYAENVRLSNAWHFDSPMHPQTREALARELVQVVSTIPVPKAEETRMPVAVDAEPTPRPIMKPLVNKQGEWDFLRPVSRLKSVPGKDLEAADAPHPVVAPDVRVSKQSP